LELSQLLLELFLLLRDKTTKKLLLETVLCDSEIDDGGLGSELRREVRVAETGGHVEAELVIVVHVGVGNLDELVTALHDDLLLKDGVENRVDLIFDLLDQDGVALHERELEGILKRGMVEGEDAIFLNEVSFSSLDPRDGLTLGIDHERISGGSGDHDTVLNGQLISRQSFEVPLSYSGIIDQELGKLHIVGGRNSTADQVSVEELVDELGTEVRVEGAAVRNEGTSLGDITNKT